MTTPANDDEEKRVMRLTQCEISGEAASGWRQAALRVADSDRCDR